MKVLVIGHPLVVDANRKFWSVFARENEAQTEVVCPRDWTSNLINRLSFVRNESTDGNLIVHPLPVQFMGNGSLFFFTPWALWTILRSKKFDAIVVTQETWSLCALEVALLKTFSVNRKTRSYLSLCQNIKKKKLIFAWPLEWFITSFYTKMLYCESAICDVLQWKRIRNPTLYFPFTYDEEVYGKVTPEPSPVLRVGYIGRLTEEKGIRDLVTAVNKLTRPTEIVIVGNGPLKDWLLTQPRVKYLGILPHKEAHRFYEKIDLLVLPSKTTAFWKEQFGRVIIESVASGKPVVGSSSGAIPEVLGKIGLTYVFREGDPDDLARQIERVLADMRTPQWGRTMESWIGRNALLFSQKSQAKSLGQDIRER